MVLTRSATRRLADENMKRVHHVKKQEQNNDWLNMTVFALPLVLYATTTVSIERLIISYFILSVVFALVQALIDLLTEGL